MIANTVLRHATRQGRINNSRIIHAISRGYVSRAHPPESLPSFTIEDALNQLLVGIEERKVKRSAKWDRNKENREAKGIKVCVYILNINCY